MHRASYALRYRLVRQPLPRFMLMAAQGISRFFPLADVKPKPVNDITAWIVPQKTSYQPGETATGIALVRDAQGRAVDTDLRFQLVDGEGAVAQEETAGIGSAGAYAFDLKIPNGPGSWRIDLLRQNKDELIASLPLTAPAKEAVASAADSTGTIVISPGRRSFSTG